MLYFVDSWGKIHFFDLIFNLAELPNLTSIVISQVYSEPRQTYEKECFAKIVNCYKPLTIFAKHSVMFVRVLNTALHIYQYTSRKH